MKAEKTKQAKLKMIEGTPVDNSETNSVADIDGKLVEQSTTPQVSETTNKISKLDFGSLSKVLGGIAVVLGLSFHFFGHVAHEAFLAAWGLDPSQFTKSIYWTEVNGYYTVYDVLINSSSALMTDQ